MRKLVSNPRPFVRDFLLLSLSLFSAFNFVFTLTLIEAAQILDKRYQILEEVESQNLSILLQRIDLRCDESRSPSPEDVPSSTP
jgi:hypothetical protein